MSRMFKGVDKTWNPLGFGCSHGCSYCWARKLAKRSHCPDCRAFKPHLHPERLDKIPKADRLFVCSTSDLFCSGVKNEWIVKVIMAMNKHKEEIGEYLLCTKNPSRMSEAVPYLPTNTTIGITLESEETPRLRQRAIEFRDIEWPKKFVSIEPILGVRFHRLWEIKPQEVQIGYDNYSNHLDEPPLIKTLKLIDQFKGSGISVKEKTLRMAWNEGEK